jgi:hypothetical protein
MRHLRLVSAASATLLAAAALSDHAGAAGEARDYGPTPYSDEWPPDDALRPEYDAPAPGYSTRPHVYDLPRYGSPQYGPPPAYGPPPYAYRPPVYGPPFAYGVPPPGYGHPSPYAYGAPPVYEPHPEHGPPPRGYGRPPPYAYQPPSGHGPLRDHGAPPRMYELPPSAIPRSQPSPDGRRAI